MNISDAIQSVASRTKVYSGQGCTEDEINDAMRRLRFVFPQEYRDFLHHAGALVVTDGKEIGGLRSSGDGMKFITIDDLASEPWIAEWPRSVLRIAEDGGGGYYCILDASYADTSVYNADSEQVMISNDDYIEIDGLILNRVAPTLAAWIVELWEWPRSL